jgi:hypothetical protein
MGVMRPMSEEAFKRLPKEVKIRFFCEACPKYFTCQVDCEPLKEFLSKYGGERRQ